jgi:hypothetical protein
MIDLGTHDWAAIERDLFTDGYAVINGVLDENVCADLRACFDDDTLFRSHVIMERHQFGRGEYKYFDYPLPPLVAALRETAYGPLAAIANRWHEALGSSERVPVTLQTMLDLCAENDQRRPTALLLRYRAGDYNCLHQDLYGTIAFPFQMAYFLDEPGVDYEGGEFVLVEQRPRAQSRPEVLLPRRGDCIIFPNRYRPVRGKSGTYRTTFRHGVSRLRSGQRHTLGIIFHDAR